ncbi:MAG: F0F1 ATP synthase subunit epsilon [Chromatiales bacterium]|jgi:F-type H+-transporting ATPase subunit epsilon|nr:F0F1 ATP synthase subunit epsilon [Chromatiales bacterium]
MASTIHLDIVSAEHELFSGSCSMVYAPAIEGEVGIMPNHAPMVTRLKPGEVRLEAADGEEQSFYVNGGILEVQPHVVTILSDTGIRADDIDEAAAQQAKEDAERALSDQSAEMDMAAAQAELAEAVAQLRALQNLRKRGGR